MEGILEILEVTKDPREYPDIRELVGYKVLRGIEPVTEEHSLIIQLKKNIPCMHVIYAGSRQ